MDSQIWGTVPDYLIVLTIAGGAFAAIRTWRKEKREELERAEQQRLEEETRVAQVVATVVPPERSDQLTRAMIVEVRSLGGVPVFDVHLTVTHAPNGLRSVHAGSRADVEASRVFEFRQPVVTDAAPLRELEPADSWQPGKYPPTDFNWTLEFTDARGRRWRRTAYQMPVAA